MSSHHRVANQLNLRKGICGIILLGLSILIIACGPSHEEPTVDLRGYVIAEDFQLQPIVAEPLIEAPIDISFDDQGRLWVLEMQGYMRTLEGVDEEAPIGRILVMEDLDQDGAADHTKVFLDDLVLARAIAHVYRGLLYAEPPNLWFVEINPDLTPGKKTLVDPEYAIGGNVEHQPNGLLLNIDNWIYNAKSAKRYRRVNGEWQIESTSFRGQWGITRDEMGRLIYNDNSNQARGDQVIPNLLYKHGFNSESVLNTTIVDDQRVFPLQATAVNRGYTPGTLQEDGKLIAFTSACGPLYFQGQLLPNEYQGNVFVCAPEANLIKRNLLDDLPFSLTGQQAWAGKEFIASTDQGFRPVNLKNGPDGAMYIVDMHRGIIQHKAYMTSYLRDQYISRGLDSLVGMGRILRVTARDDSWTETDLSQVPLPQLVDSLSSENMWIRDRAQQMIIYSGDEDLTESLADLLNDTSSEVPRIHALYCLEGLQTLSKQHININNMLMHPRLLAHMLKLMGDFGIKLTNRALGDMIALQDSTVDYYTSYLLAKNFNGSAITYLTQLLDRYEQSRWIQEPIAVALEGDLDQFRNSTNGYANTLDFIDSVQSIPPPQEVAQVIWEDHLTQGLTHYRTHCATCHGTDGKGIRDLAPPLLASEYVGGDPRKLIEVLLYGLQGPITVNGVDYSFSAAMPGLKMNPHLTDKEIMEIGNYVRNAFTTSPQTITEEMVKGLRDQDRPADQTYTQQELKEKYAPQ